MNDAPTSTSTAPKMLTCLCGCGEQIRASSNASRSYRCAASVLSGRGTQFQTSFVEGDVDAATLPAPAHSLSKL